MFVSRSRTKLQSQFCKLTLFSTPNYWSKFLCYQYYYNPNTALDATHQQDRLNFFNALDDSKAYLYSVLAQMLLRCYGFLFFQQCHLLALCPYVSQYYTDAIFEQYVHGQFSCTGSRIERLNQCIPSVFSPATGKYRKLVEMFSLSTKRKKQYVEQIKKMFHLRSVAAEAIQIGCQEGLRCLCTRAARGPTQAHALGAAPTEAAARWELGVGI